MEANTRIARFKGHDPLWLNSDQIHYLEIEYDNETRPARSRKNVFHARENHFQPESWSTSPLLYRQMINPGHQAILIDTGQKSYRYLPHGGLRLIDTPIIKKRIKASPAQSAQANIPAKISLIQPPFQHPAEDVTIAAFDTIYFNQVYDISPSRSGLGGGCCGAASTIMGLIYYNVLKPWPVNCYTPFSHQSTYGLYISEIYSLNGVTYDRWNTRSNGSTGWGIYGYIYWNSLQDTKGYMRDLIKKHGIYSETDWSPYFDKLKSEIDQQQPMVVLNSITSSGHYIVATGYVPERRIAIFNDPYGNANNESYPSYYGIKIHYDWPGESNGYANLNIVHCFNYMRPATDLVTFYDYKYSDDSLWLTCFVKNAGVIATPTSAQYNFSISDYASGDTLAQSAFQVPPLAPLETIRESFAFPIDSFGAYYRAKIKMTLTPDTAFNEIYTTNNQISKTLSLKKDSITITSLTPPPDTIIYDSTISLKIKLLSADSLITDSAHCWLDSTEITGDCSISRTYIRAKLENVSNGAHTLRVHLMKKGFYLRQLVWQVHTQSPTGIEELNTEHPLENSLTLFPNPCRLKLNVSFNNPLSTHGKFYIFDMAGRKIDEGAWARNEKILKIDVSNYPSGVYFISMSGIGIRPIIHRFLVIH